MMTPPLAPSPVGPDYYLRPEVVRRYAGQSTLQRAEQVILGRIGERRLAASRVLDLGVGGGRTTAALAGRCRGYVGVDLSEPMIAACRQRFPGLHLEVADARALPFADAAFDLVLFSFNGIDLVGDAAQRRQVLAECARVLAPGGAMIHSSHNLNWLDSRAAVRWAGSLRVYLETQHFWGRMRRLNRDRLRQAGPGPVELIDPCNGGATRYLRPEAMIDECRAAGWRRVHLFDLAGHERVDGPEIAAARDPWLYLMSEGR